MLVPCPHRGDHFIRRGRMHGPDRCPPKPGARGDHHRRKRQMRKLRAQEREFAMDSRGVAVAGTSGSQAKTARAGKKKIHATA